MALDQYLNEQETFLSTLSLRRATASKRAQQPNNQISIHALLAESDKLCNLLLTNIGHFYPRSPCGERLRQIAIHTIHN